MQIEVERSNRVHILEHYYTKVLYSKLQLSAYLLCYDTVYFYQLLNERGALEGACYDSIGLHSYTQIHRTALFISSFPSIEAHVQYDLEVHLGVSCTISISEPHILQYSVLGEFRSLST